MSYRGPTAATPIAVSASAVTTLGTSHPLPQVTATSDANQLIHVVGLSGSTTATVPSGVAARAAQAGNVSLLMADRYQPRPGMSPAANATTATAVNSASLTVAIVPGATDQRLGYAGHSDNPSHLNNSSGALIERYHTLTGGVSATEKATTQPTGVFSDDFTGANGAVWNASKWTTTSNDTSKKVDIQSNQGELYVNGASARATATMTSVVNSEATFSYRFSDRNASSFLRIFLRASGATGANQMPNAYRVEIASNSSTIALQKFVGNTVTQLGSFTYSANTSTQRVRFRVQDNVIQARVWPDGTAEPTGWSLTATDSAVTAAGVLQIAHSHTSGARSVYLDDLLVTSGVTPDRTWSYPNLHGDVTATADNSGTRTWIGWFGPFGENGGGSNPVNTASQATSWGWHGQQQRLSDRGLIHMGARPYIPGLGRFLAVDPVEGGCANFYVYVYGDPVNSSDVSGKSMCDIPVWGSVIDFLGFGGLLSPTTGEVISAGVQNLGPWAVEGGATHMGKTAVANGAAKAGSGGLLGSGIATLAQVLCYLADQSSGAGPLMNEGYADRSRKGQPIYMDGSGVPAYPPVLR